jgi:hypothetical protein
MSRARGECRCIQSTIVIHCASAVVWLLRRCYEYSLSLRSNDTVTACRMLLSVV